MTTEINVQQPNFFDSENVFDYIYQVVSVKDPEEEISIRDYPYYQQILIRQLMGGVKESGDSKENVLKDVLCKGFYANCKVFARFAKLLDLRVAGGTIGLNRYFLVTYMDGWWFMVHNDDYVPQQLDAHSFKSVMDHPSTKVKQIRGGDKKAFMKYTTEAFCK